MQQAQEHQRQVRREARHYGLLVGYAGGVLAVLQVSMGGAAASENLVTVLSLQRSLVNLSLGGGANPIPSVEQLGPMWTLVGVMSFLLFCATLWLCGVAGRLAAIATGDRSAGRTAGGRTALVTSGVWILASLLGAAIFHVDGGFSWLFATIVVLMMSSAPHMSNVLLTAPSSQFVVAHLAILATTHLIALLITWGLGTLAGSIGANTARRHTIAAPGMPSYAVPMYPPQMAAYPPQAMPYYPPAAYLHPQYPYYPQYPQQQLQQPQYPQYPQHAQYPQYPQPQQAPYPPVAYPPRQDVPPTETPAPPAE